MSHGASLVSGRSRRASAMLVALLAISCADASGPGERCVADADCDDDLGCYQVDATSSRRCLAACDPAAVVVCAEASEGSVGLCVGVEGGETPGVCLVGGKTEPGASCTSSVECAPSGVCVLTGDTGVCEPACDTAAPVCPPGEACVALGGAGRRGHCATAPDGGV